MGFSLEDARAALNKAMQQKIDEPFEYGFLGRIVDDGVAFEFKIAYKPGYFWCRIENALGLIEAECRSRIALDPYTRVKFERVNGVLEAIQFMGDDAARNYGWAGGTMDVMGLPPPNRGMGGPLDMDDDDILNVGLLQLTELELSASTELTIASGAITVTQAFHRVDTQADASSDDLDTITIASTRPFAFWLRAENTARTVVVKHGAGNIRTFSAADITLDETYQLIFCLYDPALSQVLVLGGAASGGGGGSGQVADVKKTILTTLESTSSTTLTPVDATNVGYTQHSHTLVVGDVVRCIWTGQFYNNSPNYAYYELEIDQPTSGDIYLNAASASGTPSYINYEDATRRNGVYVFTFVATEAGIHAFRPVWRTNAGTVEWGNDSTPGVFTSERLSGPSVAIYSDDALAGATPTQAELVTAFGAASAFEPGTIGLLDDGGAGTDLFHVSTDGVSWAYVALTVPA